MIDLGKLLKLALGAVILLGLYSIFGSSLNSFISYGVSRSQTFLSYLGDDGKTIVLGVISAIIIGIGIAYYFNSN